MTDTEFVATEQPRQAFQAGPRIAATRQRWQVLYEQLRSGHEPCYGTDRRLTCKETSCRWRASCVTSLRAEWRR